MFSLVMEEKVSLLDELLASYPAQLANAEGMPSQTMGKCEDDAVRY